MLQHILRWRLFRATCPSSENLVAYQQNTLTSGQHQEIAHHLAHCPHCVHELQMVQRMVEIPADIPPAPNTISRSIMARLQAPRPFMPISRLRMERPTHYAYQTEGLQLTLSIAFEQAGHVAISGELLFEEPSAVQLVGATATLLANEQVLHVTPINRAGHFTIKQIVSGEYSLSLRLRNSEMLVETLRV